MGYSDHSKDGSAVLAAVARGAKVIERHITILKNVPNVRLESINFFQNFQD